MVLQYSFTTSIIGEMDGANQTISQENPSLRVNQSSPKSKAPLVIFIVLLLVALGFGAWFMFFRNTSEEPEDTNTTEIVNDTQTIEESFPTEEPTPTVKEVDRSEITIQVLNGSGITGEAGYLQGVLASLGYDEIKTGNASKQNLETTTVSYSEDIDEAIQKEITGKLKDVYKKVEEKTSSAQKDYDVIITVGLRKNQTAPTAVPTKAVTPTVKPTGSVTPTSTTTPTPSITSTP